MSRFILFLLLPISLILAQTSEVPTKTQESSVDKPAQHNVEENIKKTEESLNGIMAESNKAMQDHARLLVLKLITLPKNSVAFKGKAKGDDCEKSVNQEDPANDCFSLEQFDFVDGEGPANKGPKSKFVILFFDAGTGVKDPKAKDAARKVTKIRSRFYVHNFKTKEKRVLETIDTDPLGDPAHDDKIFTTVQIDDKPLDMNAEENPGEVGVGKYKLSSVTNQGEEPIRNHFKQEGYIKHLIAFERMFKKIYTSNELKSNKDIKNNNLNLKGSLNY